MISILDVFLGLNILIRPLRNLLEYSRTQPTDGLLAVTETKYRSSCVWETHRGQWIVGASTTVSRKALLSSGLYARFPDKISFEQRVLGI